MIFKLSKTTTNFYRNFIFAVCAVFFVNGSWGQTSILNFGKSTGSHLNKKCSSCFSRLFNRLFIMPLTLPICLVLVLGIGNVWGQTPNGTLDFGTTANGTTATTGNTGFGGVRVGTAGGGFTIQNAGQSIGADGELRGIAPTSGSINSFGITSTEYGTAATTFTISFELHLSGGSSGTWYFFAGNGASFGSAQSATFTSAQVFTGIRWAYGASSAITTNNRVGTNWNATGLSTPFAQSTSYYVTIIGNNSSSTVNYGASNAYSVAAYKYDLWINGSLAGNDLGKGQLTNSTSINAFRFYGESSTSNVATIALDNIRWYNTCTLPPTHLALVSVPTTGTVGSNLTSFTSEARSGSSTGPVANSFTGAITVAKVSGAGSISGTTAPNATAGVATYSNIQFSSADTYTIKASAAAPIVDAATSSNITVSSSTPSITLADNGSQVSASSVAAGSTNVILHQSSLAVTTANATLTGVSFTTAGTYAAADVSNFKVWYSADNSFATTVDNTQLGSTITTSLGAGAKSVSSLSQAINSGSTGYIFITTDIAASPTGGNTINISALTTSNVTFSSGSKSGSTAAGGAKTLQSASSPTLSAGTISGSFGNICINTTSSAQSFTLSGSNLNGTDVTVSSTSSRYTFATSSGGSYSNPLTLTSYDGSSLGTIHVKFAPTAAGADNANISIAGGGASAATVSQSSNSGVNTVPTVTTPTTASLSTTTVTLGGTISSIGCSNATTTGIYYSTSNGFADGAGTAVSTSSLNISSTPNVFTQAVTGLTANTQYYFKAFATNSGGNGYSSQGSFITFPTAPAGLSAGSITNSGFTVSWTDLAGTLEFYEVQIFNDAGFSTQVGSTYTTAANTSSQAISGLTASTNYYYRVRAVNNTNQYSSYTTGGPVTTAAGPCGTESFTNSNATTSYSNNSFTGENGVTWTYTASRDENGDANGSGISGKALMLRRSSDGSKVVSSTLATGIGNFSVKLYKGFTGSGSRQVELFINDVSYGTSTSFDNYLLNTFSVNNINIAGNVVIDIRNTTGNQVIVDDISWTCYSAPEINIKQSSTNLASGSGSYSFGNTTLGGSSSAVAFTVENVGTETLNLTGTPKVAISGNTGDFTINQISTSSTVSASGSTTFTVTFSPTTTGLRSATISIANDDSNENPYTFTITGTGATYAPSVTTFAATSISTTGATLNGDVTSDGGANVTERGFVYKTSGSVTISDNQTIVAGTTGIFSLSPSSLSASTRYYFRAFAINSVNTTLGSELNFWTLANTPSAPAVNTPTSSSLNVSIGGADGNSSTTAYAIQETTSGNYVQANGTLGVSAVWQTASNWSAITVIGLSSATTYTFKVKARNGDNVETASFSATTSGTTSSIGLDAVILSSALTSTYGSVSSGVNFTASGTNLTSNIIANAQTGYQVSTDDLTYVSSVSVASGTTVYVRFMSALLVGNYNNQVAVILSGGGASSSANVTTSLAGNTVSQKALTLAGLSAENKTYDGLTTATFTGTLTGVVSPDVVTFAGSGTFASINVGTGIAITSTATLGGAGAANYTLTQPTGIAANITAKSLTITANNVTKEIGATLTSGAGSTDFTSSGLVGSQTIGSVTLTYGTGASAGDAIGSYSNQVTPSAATGGTFLASNYSISYLAGNLIVQNTTAVIISSLCSPFTENFNTLASSGTSSTTPAGWYFSELNSSANVLYSAGTGGSNSGDTYSFGSSTSDSDRSFGGLRSGSLNPTVGAKYINNTGSTINALTVSYTGETWRVGTASRSDRLDFQYSTNATSLTTGTWTDVNNLDYTNPGQATGSGSLQHSTSISSEISSLSIANGATFWIRWSDIDATGADDGMGVDDFCITACQCASPDALAFVQQPTNVSQGVAMAPSVTVKAICSSSGGTANSYTGNITLTASGGGCGYVSQTVTAVNGVATFNNIVFTRSIQTGITLTASASALTDAVSSTFNVTSGGGISTSTDIRNDNFSGPIPDWPWTSGAVSVGSGGTSGIDVTGVTSAGGNTYLRKSYSADNSSSQKGTISTITFANTTSLSSYNALTFTFKIASLNSTGNVNACSGCGVDGPDYLYIETSVNGGTSWQRILTHVGKSDKLFVFGGSVLSLTYGTNTILDSSSTQSAFSVSIPSGTSQFQFRMIARNNRTGENWCIDDVKLVGESYSGAVTSPLPTVSAFGATNICAGSSAYLYSSVSNAVGALTYDWLPASGLSATNTNDVTATLNGTQSYTVTVTDGDNCLASSSAVTVTVDSPSTPVGDWLGTYSNDWFDCRNWKGKVVPSTTTDVTILSGTIYSPVIAQPGANCRALTIQNSAALTVNDPTSALDVYGAYTNNGSLSHTNGQVTLTGSAAYNADCGTSSPFYNLKINNSSSGGITLVINDMVISNQLSLVAGVISTNSGKVIMTSTNASDLLHSSGNASFIFGTLRRFIASNTSVYELPVGLSYATSDYRRADFINDNLVGVNYVDASVRSITETGNNIDSRLATSQIGSSLTDVIGSSIWSLVPNAPPPYSGKYGVNLYVANLGLSAMDDNTFCPVKRNDFSTDYADWSTFEQSTTIPAAGLQGRIYDSGNGYAQRLGYSTFSEHAFGKTPSMQPLPVQLTLFKASCYEKSDALINWATATEKNSDYFEVEVSTDLVSWAEVAQVNAAGNSTSKREYTISDNLSRGLRYYRLVQVDFDGKQRIYDPISLNCGDAESVFLIYPNPTSGDFVVSIQNEKLSGEIVVTLNTADGKLIASKTSEATTGVQSIYFENNQLPAGIYFVRITDKTGNELVGKMVVR
jgi:hypothetical protein